MSILRPILFLLLFLFSSFTFAVDTDGDGVDDNLDLWPADSRFALDADLDTIPDEWEVLHGRDPLVADYAIEFLSDGTFCIKDENGSNCLSSVFLFSQVASSSIIDSTECSPSGEPWEVYYFDAYDVDIDYEIVGASVLQTTLNGSVTTDYSGYVDYGSCVGGTENHVNTKYQTDINLARQLTANENQVCVLGAEGVRCFEMFYWGTGAYPGESTSWAPYEIDVSTLNIAIDSDGDGIDRSLDPDDFDSSIPWQDSDSDGDGVDDNSDNCPFTSNPGQSDNDNDGIGNACDPDVDGDGVDDTLDSHPLNPVYFSDFDRDKLNAHEDNCPFVKNGTQTDTDGDGFGNACDTDIDNDGFEDAIDSHPSNASLFTDFDRDAVNSHEDNCPFLKNPGQSDNDGDGLGNACDPDVDGDGVDDESDSYPLNPNLW